MMKSIIKLGVVSVGVLSMFTGCNTNTQETIDSYVEKRNKVINKVKATYDKKECIKVCNTNYDLGLNRANCKANCLKGD